MADDAEIITLVYLRNGDVLATVRTFRDWHEVQAAFPDYMTSLGPWSRADTVGFIEDDWAEAAPASIARLDALLASGEETRSLVWDRQPG